MSKSSQTDDSVSGGSEPRAMIHKKILEVARSDPDASLESIADEVGGASAAFVDRVLEEYGDPAATSSNERADGKGKSQSSSATNATSTLSQNGKSTDTEKQGGADVDHSDTDNPGRAVQADQDTETSEPPEQGSATTDTPDNSESATPAEVVRSPPKSSTNSVDDSSNDGSDADPVTSPSELSDKQRETLRSVQQEPTATQEEIANKLGVTRATISKRLNNIPGFNWKTRRKFVDEVFDDAQSADGESEGTEPTPTSKLAELESRIDELEAQLATAPGADNESSLGPELTHKVVHSCMDADYLSEDEELELLRKLL